MTITPIATDVSDCRERIAAADDSRLIEVTRLPGTGVIELDTESLSDAADLALDLDVSEGYLQVVRTESGDVTRAVFAFVHDGVLHTVSRTSDRERGASRAAGADGDATSTDPGGEGSAPAGAGTAASEGADSDADATPTGTDAPEAADELDAEKAAVAEELLSSYGEYLDDGDKYQLTYRLETTSLPQLERMRDEARAAAKADPEAEERLARIVFRDGRFNDDYTVEDTEMLLNALDVDYDPETVRLAEVHRRAMSLRTINE